MSNFYFSGLDKNGWFSRNFEDYHLFGYVGDRERLLEKLNEKSFLRRVAEIFAPKLSIDSIVNSLASYDLVNTNQNNSIAKEIMNLVNEYENKKQLDELLARTYKEGKKVGTYFENASFKGGAGLKTLQGKLITIEGSLVHRSTIAQYSTNTEASLRSSDSEWLLCDFPPHGLAPENSRYLGKVVLLKEDKGFSDTFQSLLPFCKEIGWYPYVRITGFADLSKINSEIHPSMSICLIEYRRPKLVEETEGSIGQFLEVELHGYSGRRNHLKEKENLLLFSYLLPIIYRGSNKLPNEASKLISDLTKEYIDSCEGSLPTSLVDFYRECGSISS